MKITGPRTEPCGTPQVRGDAGKLCEGFPTVDVRDERYEVNHCSEIEEMPNQVERRWSGREYQRQLIDQEDRQETCCMETALERWSCRESSVVSVEWNLV